MFGYVSFMLTLRKAEEGYADLSMSSGAFINSTISCRYSST